MDEMKRIRNREEIPEEDKWAIEDLYATDELWEQELATIADDQATLQAFAGHLSDSAETLWKYLDTMEKVNVKGEKLANYCMRKSDEDTRVAKYQAMVGSFMNVFVGLSAATSFETPEILSISDEKLDAFFAEEPKLERYRRYLTSARRMKDHILSPAEEKLLASAGEMAGAPDSIYGMFADADMKFPDAVDSEGNKHPLSQGTFVQCESSPDRALRKSAYENLYHSFEGFKNTAAAILNAQGKQLKFFSDARKYPTTLEAALDRTEVPTSVYLNLIEAVHKNFDKMHRYVRLRKKLLGVDELHFYDVYAPLLADVDNKVPYAEAKQTIYEAMAPLGEDYRAILQEGFNNRWVDVYQNEG